MIAKIVVWGVDREAARRRLVRALADTALVGVATNLGFLARLADDPEYAAARIDTGFIERRREALLMLPGPPPDFVLAAAVLTRLVGCPDEPRDNDPWSGADGWRLNLGPAPRSLVLRCGDADHTVAATRDGEAWHLDLGGRSCRASGERQAEDRLVVVLDGTRRKLRVLEHGAAIVVLADGESWRIEEIDPLCPPAGITALAGHLTSPMPGRVAQLLVAPGERVRQGQPLMVVEAMKMEHTIAAPRDGVVAAVHYRMGDLVEEGAELLALADSDDGRD
jgi:3-methylcrotonyl-CoA carboxylase alpha subunit